MFIGKMDGQMSGINVQSVNRSAALKAGKSPAEIEQLNGQMDKATISPGGKKQSMMEQLMKQKEFLEDRKQSLMDSASENGTQNMEMIKQYDEQLKQIDEQISQLQAEETMDPEKEAEDKEGVIYEKPRTKEEAKADQIRDISNMASTLDQAETISAVKNEIDGRARVLKSEISTGNGNIEKKIEEVADLENKSEQLTANMAEKAGEVNKSMSDKTPVKEEEVIAEDEKVQNTAAIALEDKEETDQE